MRWLLVSPWGGAKSRCGRAIGKLLRITRLNFSRCQSLPQAVLPFAQPWRSPPSDPGVPDDGCRFKGARQVAGVERPHRLAGEALRRSLCLFMSRPHSAAYHYAPEYGQSHSSRFHHGEQGGCGLVPYYCRFSRGPGGIFDDISQRGDLGSQLIGGGEVPPLSGLLSFLG